VGDELSYNLFMLTADPALQAKLGTNSPDATMAMLREMKNNF
jgi:hypothetical protein